jgi:hypothetical protein
MLSNVDVTIAVPRVGDGTKSKWSNYVKSSGLYRAVDNSLYSHETVPPYAG